MLTSEQVPDYLPNHSLWSMQLYNATKKYGGLFNAHAHLDRADTLNKIYLEHMSMDPIEASTYPLKVKQNLTGDLHRGPAYRREDLEERMRNELEFMHRIGTRRVDSCIDTTADNVGLMALEIALNLKKEFAGKIDFRVGAYPIFGFKTDDEPERLTIFREGAKMADFIVGLPERDVKVGHVGYDGHLKIVLETAIDLKKPLHVHVDQGNDPDENGTETLIEAVRWRGSPHIKDESTSVWAIHAISPSGYEEDRFRKVVDGLVKYNIGVVVCPSAAISMRQKRSAKVTTHNSIARVLEFVEAGIPVRIGSDNISDIFVPSGTGNLYLEIWLLSNAMRFYNTDTLAKLATETKPNNMDRELIRRALEGMYI